MKLLTELDSLDNVKDGETRILPTKVSDLTNDTGYITGLVMLEYGTSTWQDFQNAFNSNKIVYCKVNGRMAFLAYISTSNVEFQYYRSLSSPSVSSQPDEVYVYTLTNANKWTTTTRKASSTIAVGTGLSRSYTANTRTMTLSVDTSTMAQKSDLPTKTSDLTNDSGFITGYTEIDPVFSTSAASGITSTDITNWNNKSDFSGSYNDLTNKPTIPTVPTNISAFTNDSGYITGITGYDVIHALEYTPAAEPNIYAYNSIRDITSTSNQTYIDLMDDMENNRPIVIQAGINHFDVIGTSILLSGNSSLWFMTSNNSYTKITFTVSGTSVTVTTATIEIPTKTSDLTNDSNFVDSTLTGSLSNLTTTDQSSLVNAINEVNEKNIIMMHLTGSQSFGNAYTKLNLSARTTIGTKLSVSSNQVKIGSGVNHIKVSGTLGYEYKTAGNRYLRITKNFNTSNIDRTTIAMQLNYETTANHTGTLSITDIVIPVSEGDLIGMYVYGLSGDSARYTSNGMIQTNMTVEVID